MTSEEHLKRAEDILLSARSMPPAERTSLAYLSHVHIELSGALRPDPWT